MKRFTTFAAGLFCLISAAGILHAQEGAVIDGAVIYDYDPSTKLGDDVFGTIICDHENDAPGRNSHGGPVCMEYPNGDLVAFYTNTSGHNVDGWSEYAVSKDGGRTWDKNNKFKYTYDAYLKDPKQPAWVFEGLVTQKGTIVLFINHFASEKKIGIMRSYDNGSTWTDCEAFLAGPGSPMAAAVEGDTNYVLFANGWNAPHVFYVSKDDGLTWRKRSTLFDGDKGYGALCVMADGRLLAGAYDKKDEHFLYYCISKDKGHTWSEQKKTYLDKKIRDPELAYLAGKYYLHGRTGHYGEGRHRFAMYQSDDGVNWGSGILIHRDARKSDGYSANCIINKYKKNVPNELMVVYSICYNSKECTNEYVFFVKPEAK